MDEPVMGVARNPDAVVALGRPLGTSLLGAAIESALVYRRELAARLDSVFAAMRRDGQGLSLGQETEIRKGLGLV